MKVIFKQESWIIKDILDAMVIASIEDYENLMYEQHGVKPNKEVMKFINRLRKQLDFENKYLKFMGNQLVAKGYVHILVNKLFNAESVHEIPEILRKVDIEEVKFKILKNFLEEENEDVNEAELDIKDKIKTLEGISEILDGLSLSNEEKWALFDFCRISKKYFEEYALIIEKLIPHYLKGVDKFKGSMDKFNKKIHDRINIEGKEVFSELLQDMVGYYDKKNVYITSSAVNSKGMMVNFVGEDAYIYVGFEIEDSIETIRGKNEQETILKVAGTISDPMKFKILCCMKDKEVYGREICEATGLSKAALSYHIGQLINMGLVKYNKIGNKIFYSLKREFILESIDKLKKFF